MDKEDIIYNWNIIKGFLQYRIPKKYLLKYDSAYCPTCGNLLLEESLMDNAPYEGDQFCGYCEQSIDWSK